MSAIAVLLVALVSISALVSAMLAVAWIDLGRPRHARTWSAAFAIATVAWALVLAGRAVALPPPMAALMPLFLGLATAMVTIGFRQRAGLPDARRLLVGLGVAHGLLLFVLMARYRHAAAWVAPLALFNGAMYWLASRTLLGRRRGERLAEQVAETGLCLLAALHLFVAGALAGAAAGLVGIDLARLGTLALLLLPSVEGIVGLYTIILITADLADRTRRLAATDMLTGLLNRRGFEAAANNIVAATRRSQRSMALVMIDIDHFKEINDRFGHPAGDRVLCGVCGRIAQTIGRRDLFARVGGEEFAVILMDVDAQAAACAVEVMRREVEAMVADLPVPHTVTASFGVAVPHAAEDNLAGLIRHADRALYRAKAEGRNRVALAA